MIRSKMSLFCQPEKKKGNNDPGPRVVLVQNFTPGAVNRFRRDIDHCLNMEQEIIPVVIDSYGGSVYSLLAMLDIIEMAKKKALVPTVVEGKAMSCGAILFSAGSEGHRYMAPSSTLLIHDVSSMSVGKSGDLEADANEVKRLNKLIYSTMAVNTGNEPSYFYDQVQARGRADWFLTPKQCRKHRIANKIHLPVLDVEIKLKFG